MHFKKLNFSFYILILLFFTTTCKKSEEKTFISGVVTDAYSKQPVPEADVYVEEFQYSGTIIYDKHTVASIKTDASGAFSYEYLADETFGYHVLEIQKPSECYYHFLNQRYGITPHERNNYRIEGVTNASYNIHVKNTSPFNSNDSLCFFYTTYTLNSLMSIPCTSPVVGMGVDFNVFEQSIGGGKRYLYLRWVVTKNSIQTEHYDSVYLTPCDTTNFNLFY